MAVRRADEGLIYVRRSDDRQELSMPLQLDWGLAQAAKEGVRLDATQADLRHMLARGLHSYKSIRMDDAISGSDMERPGFIALLDDPAKDRRISHIFVYRRDRLARPEDAFAMVVLERKVKQSGVTIVLNNRIVHPTAVGETDLSEDLTALIEYYNSGEFLKVLAERVLNALCARAKDGCWTGGSAPYGFVRVLVDPQGKELEILPRGRTVRQEGCRVRIRPDTDLTKIQTWLLILDLKASEWGAKRIARRLNSLGIPSPDAGRIRKDQGIPHLVSGRWNATTVLDLCRNPAIIGLMQYGRRSEGKHRRLGKDGSRLLTEGDRTDKGKTRLLQNDPSIIIQAKAKFAAPYVEDKWLEIQEQLKDRGKQQRGIPRTKDPAKYPLSCRVVDMTNGCGSIMYGRENGKRRLYVCGRYMRTSGGDCNNNAVDAEALLRFTLATLRQFAHRHSNLEELRSRIKQMAEEELGNGRKTDAEVELATLKSQRAALAKSIDFAVTNLARASDEWLFKQIESKLQEFRKELEELDRKIGDQSVQPTRSVSLEQEVDAALALLNRIETVTSDASAREGAGRLFSDLNLRIGLEFRAGTKGKKRQVRHLVGGVFAMGQADLPVQLHGQDRIQLPELLRGTPDAPVSGVPTISEGDTTVVHPVSSRLEGVSFTKVSRGDRI